MTDKEAKAWAASYAAMKPRDAEVLRICHVAMERSMEHTVVKNDNGTYSHTFKVNSSKVG